MLESIKKIDKKLLMMMGFVLFVIVLIIILMVVMSVSTGGKISYEKIEKKLEQAAEKYYKDNDSDLPKKVGDIIKIDADELVSEGYIKDLSEYTEENVTCSAEVIVGKTVDGYDYVAALNCDEDYKTEFLADKLISSDVVTTGDGLYKLDEIVTTGEVLGMDDEGYDLSSNELMSGYIYRGEKPNNYVLIDEQLYQIVKIDGKKDLTLLSMSTKLKSTYDNRYNSEEDKNVGINDYTKSRALEKIQNQFENKEEKDGLIKNKIVSKNICIGPRSDEETTTDSSVECSVVMKNQLYGMLTINDVILASLDENCDTTLNKECENYNYLMPAKTSYWTITPSTEDTYMAYRVATKEKQPIELIKASSSSTIRYTYYLSNRLVYVSGTGTKTDPYIVK